MFNRIKHNTSKHSQLTIRSHGYSWVYKKWEKEKCPECKSSNISIVPGKDTYNNILYLLFRCNVCCCKWKRSRKEEI